jgi:hypothetical protein
MRANPDWVQAALDRRGRDEIWPIGLDGSFTLAPDGQGLRGYWADPQTLVIQIFEDGLTTRRVRFAEDRVEITSPELGLRFEGRIEDP